MSFNIILSVCVALSVLLSASPINAGELIDDYTNSPILVGNPSDPIIAPKDVQLIISGPYSSYNAYEKSFTLDPSNGEDANLWIKNTSTDTLYARITMGSNSPLEVSIDKYIFWVSPTWLLRGKEYDGELQPPFSQMNIQDYFAMTPEQLAEQERIINEVRRKALEASKPPLKFQG